MVRWKRILFVVPMVLILAGVGILWRRGRAVDPMDEAHRALEAGNRQRAEELLRPLVRERPGDTTVALLYARVLRGLRRYDQAELALQHAVDCGLDRSVARRELALLLAEQNLPRDAEGILQQVVREYPDDEEVLQTIAQGYARHRRWLEAEPLWGRLSELRPNEIEPLLQRGLVRMEAHHHEAATEDFRRVLARNPNHFQARLSLAHCLLSEAQMPEAEAELLVCRRMRPDRPEPLVGLAGCALENADPATAEQRLTEALELDRGSPLVLHAVADLHLRRGRYDLAEEVLAVLVKAQPDDKQGHLQLAQVYRRKGELKLAAQHEQRYQELDRVEEARAKGMR
jgi:predicted Zn-dependent protease